MAKRIAFTGKQELCVEEFQTKATLEASEVRVKGICSLISTGTENIVFNRIFDAGTVWDNWVRYPFYPGYSLIGEVVECGADVTRLKVGDRVAARYGHTTEIILPESACHLVPPSVRNEDAVWFALSKIAFTGARAAGYVLGSRVLIIGGGPIGQLSARWALAAGAGKVVMIEPQKQRLVFAERAGIHAGIGNNLVDGRAEILDAFGGKLPECVVDTTGAAPVFSQALEVCEKFGTVVLLGDTGTPAKQCLSQMLVHNGLRVVGAHDSHFTEAEALNAFWPLLMGGRFNLDKMITHFFSIDKAKDAYGLANERRGETMGIMFDLSK